MGFSEVLTLIFITLKLTHYIDWSWWWVLSPTLIVWGIIAILGTIYLLLTSPAERALNAYKRRLK